MARPIPARYRPRTRTRASKPRCPRPSKPPGRQPRKLFAVLDDFGEEVMRNQHILEALRSVAPKDVDDLCRRLHELKFTDEIQGTIKMTVEQQVCVVCRQGNPPGIFLQFSSEYPNVRILITAQDTTELMIIQGGKILTSQ